MKYEVELTSADKPKKEAIKAGLIKALVAKKILPETKHLSDSFVAHPKECDGLFERPSQPMPAPKAKSDKLSDFSLSCTKCIIYKGLMSLLPPALNL